MTEEVKFEVSEIHAEMLENVEDELGPNADRKIQEAVENFIHTTYQQVQRSKGVQQDNLAITAPEDREDE